MRKERLNFSVVDQLSLKMKPTGLTILEKIHQKKKKKIRKKLRSVSTTHRMVTGILRTLFSSLSSSFLKLRNLRRAEIAEKNSNEA